MQNRLKTLFLIGLTCGALNTTATATASEQALRRFFSEVTSLSADFTQRVEDESGSTLEVTSGKFYLSRPGKFRWDYKAQDFDGVGFDEDDSKQRTDNEATFVSPQLSEELGQQIVADGQYLYFYDPDLEQVSQRSLDDALGQVPSLLLVQTGANIDEHFAITDFGLTDGLSWVALKPKDPDSGYRQLMLAFDQSGLRSLQLYDGLGNTTRLQLSNVNTAETIAPDMFKFSVPEGTDVLTQ